jgi:hypothetical protein
VDLRPPEPKVVGSSPVARILLFLFLLRLGPKQVFFFWTRMSPLFQILYQILVCSDQNTMIGDNGSRGSRLVAKYQAKSGDYRLKFQPWLIGSERYSQRFASFSCCTQTDFEGMLGGKAHPDIGH